MFHKVSKLCPVFVNTARHSLKCNKIRGSCHSEWPAESINVKQALLTSVVCLRFGDILSLNIIFPVSQTSYVNFLSQVLRKIFETYRSFYSDLASAEKKQNMVAYMNSICFVTEIPIASTPSEVNLIRFPVWRWWWANDGVDIQCEVTVFLSFSSHF